MQTTAYYCNIAIQFCVLDNIVTLYYYVVLRILFDCAGHGPVSNVYFKIPNLI